MQSTRLPSYPLSFLCGVLALVVSSIPLFSQTTQPGWRQSGVLPAALAGHRMQLLPTGEVLVCGGIQADGNSSRTSYLYSSATGTFRPTLNQLNRGRAYHEVVAVMEGTTTRLFAIGGFSGTTGNYQGEASIEVLEYDAGQDNWRWRPVGALGTGRGDLRAVWDGEDHIVITGGYEGGGGSLPAGMRSDRAERLDITTLALENLPAMDARRAAHTAGRIIDENGLNVVLVAGGEENSAATATQILEGVLWNAIANPPLMYHSDGVGFGDVAGIARSFGGLDAGGNPSDICEWYDVKRGWRTAPRMNVPRSRFDATLVAGLSDTALVYLAVAGQGTSNVLSETELFQLPGSAFPNGSWVPFPSLKQAGSERRIAIAGSNLPIVTGGRDGGTMLDGLEVFQPLRADDLFFGDEEVGRRSDSIQLTIRNEWLLPVQVRDFRIGGSPAFFFRGDTADFVIPAGGSRTLRLYFQPGSTGRHNGELIFDVGELTNRVKLNGNGITSTLAVINSPADIGAVFLKERREFCFYALQNNGSDTAVIDSIALNPAESFRLVSPKGRAVIPPGDSLRVCVEFTPDERGTVGGVATIHLANRAYPAQIIGHGVRRYVTASVISSECDTVVFIPDTEISGFIRLENPGDSAVQVLLPTLSQSVAGLFRLADPSIFPLDLLPGETRLIEIIFSPARETRESVTLSFPNNGDTAASASLCFVTRSRYLDVSQSSLDFGNVCVGDTVAATLLLENPGGFDTVALRSAAIDPMGEFSFSGFSPVTLGPREYVRLMVKYAPQGAGAVNGALTVQNSQGELVVPITGTGLLAARFRPEDTQVFIGEQLVVPVSMENLEVGNSLQRASLHLQFDPTLVLPLRIVPLATGPAVNQNATRLQGTDKGEATIDIAWDGVGLVANGPAFGVEVEILRGDARRATMTLSGTSDNSLCLTEGEGELEALLPCWGEGGFIRSEKASLIIASPKPASESMTVVVISPMEGEVVVEIVNPHGEIIKEFVPSTRHGNSRSITFDASLIPPGFYLIRGRSGNRIVGTTTTIIRR